MYSVKIKNTGRYIQWCDDSWYETCSFENRKFTREEAVEVARKLVNHYVYAVTISDGNETFDLPEEKKKAEKKRPGVMSAEQRRKLFKL